MARPKMWRCPNCSAPNIKDLDTCYYCKTPRPGMVSEPEIGQPTEQTATPCAQPPLAPQPHFADPNESAVGGEIGQTNCPHCGTEILSDADQCHHCGGWIDQPNDDWQPVAERIPWIPIVSVLVAIFIVAGLSNEIQEARERHREMVKIANEAADSIRAISSATSMGMNMLNRYDYIYEVKAAKTKVDRYTSRYEKEGYGYKLLEALDPYLLAAQIWEELHGEKERWEEILGAGTQFEIEDYWSFFTVGGESLRRCRDDYPSVGRPIEDGGAAMGSYGLHPQKTIELLWNIGRERTDALKLPR